MARTLAALCYAIPLLAMLHQESAAIKNPLSLKIGKYNHAISAKAVNVPAGKTLQLTCDGSRVVNPSLWWYDNDDYYVAYRGPSNRIHVAEPSGGSRYNNNHFLKLVIRDVRGEDAGVYTCRGWFGLGHGGYFYKSIRLIVEEPRTSPQTTNQQPNTTTVYTTTTPAYTTTTTTTATTTTTPDAATPETTSTTLTPLYETTPSGNISCLDDEVVCGDGYTCGKRCDGFPDCYDNSDEDGCSSSSSCTEGKVFCGDGSGCVERSACTA